MGRLIALFYGVACYVIFVVTFLYAVGFVGGFAVPKTIDSGPVVPLGEALFINILLMGLFAVQHSVMARKGFKQWWTRFIPKQVERSTYVLLSSLALILLFWQWRPIPMTVWHIEEAPVAVAVTALSFLGWFIALTSTFLINHFQLFGLSQVADNFSAKPELTLRFQMPLYYKFVRHPIYLGFLIAFWAAPSMS